MQGTGEWFTANTSSSFNYITTFLFKGLAYVLNLIKVKEQLHSCNHSPFSIRTLSYVYIYLVYQVTRTLVQPGILVYPSSTAFFGKRWLLTVEYSRVQRVPQNLRRITSMLVESWFFRVFNIFWIYIDSTSVPTKLKLVN